MAKKRAVEGAVEIELPEDRRADDCITITVPVGGPVQGYVSNHLEIRMTPEQSEALRRLRLGLTRDIHRLANDKRVESDGDAARWLLERLGE